MLFIPALIEWLTRHRLQVARKYCPVSSLLVGVDLDLIKAIPNVTTFEADITTTKCRSELKKHLKDWKADVYDNIFTKVMA
jgi:23S rRNA U2552 (ribose-2'-O)-methylase RlmE/FtsJ